MANEHSQIVPSMQPTAKVADFKFWCQKVLPLVYDDSLSYYEVLNKMVVYLNQVIDNINADIDNVAELEDDFLLLQTYVNNFFDDIDQLVTYTERAEAAQSAAATSAINAASSASNAATSASNAAGSSGSAATSALSALDAKEAAVAAKTAAEAALANALTAANNAAASATAASGSATAASGSATNAAASAASALQNFQLSDAARVAAQEAAEDAETAASLIDMDATAADVGKAIIVKTVTDGKVSEYEFGDQGESVIPTEECLWKELFNKDYTFSGVNGRNGFVKGNHIYCDCSSSSTTSIGLPIHGTLAGAIQRYIYPTINLTEEDFIDIPPRMNDFSIEIMFANDWEQNPDSGKGMKISLFTYQNGEVVPVYDSGKFLYNYGKSITQPNILTRYPIFRETRKIYILFASASQSANQIFDMRFMLKSCVNPTVQEIIARYNEYDFTATRAYNTNSIVQIGSALYRITAPIANGAEIIENTNASRIYISDVLTAFYNS